MGIQDYLSRASAKVQRSLFDLNIHVTGRELTGMRFYISEDQYGDESTPVPLVSSNITAVVNFPPGEVPLYRFRKAPANTLADTSVDDTGIFFYDIIPFEVYTQWKDKIEKGDFLLFKVVDEVGGPMPVLLRVANALGSFHTELIWRKLLCAPYNGQAPDEVQAYIDANF